MKKIFVLTLLFVESTVFAIAGGGGGGRPIPFARTIDETSSEDSVKTIEITTDGLATFDYKNANGKTSQHQATKNDVPAVVAKAIEKSFQTNEWVNVQDEE